MKIHPDQDMNENDNSKLSLNHVINAKLAIDLEKGSSKSSNFNKQVQETKTIVHIPKNPITAYQKFVYALNILVPTDEDFKEEYEIPDGSYLQTVLYGKLKRHRVLKKKTHGLPDQLNEPRETPFYRVTGEENTGITSNIDVSGPFMRKWDNFTLVLLFFTATVTPFETAFIHVPILQIDLLFLINRFVDFCFFFDMFIQMRTPYKDSETGRIVRSRKQIIMHYLKTWFIIDLLSIFPFEFLGAAFSPSTSTTTAQSDSGSKLLLLRFLRLARLLKLLRIFRANKKLQRWKINSGLRYTTIQLALKVIVLIFMIHWIACGYRLSTDENSAEDLPGWLSNYAAATNRTTQEVPSFEAFLVATYWSSSVVTLIGSSYSAIQPTTIREFGYCFFATFVAYIYAITTIASMSDLNVHTRKHEREHEIKVDKYLKMFDGLHLNPAIKFKVHEYLKDQFALEAQAGYQGLLKELPVQWSGIINLEIFLPVLIRIPFLEPFIDKEPALMIELCRNIEIIAIPPNGMLFLEGYNGIYFLDKGMVSHEGKLFLSGSVMGEICCRSEIKKSEARALTNVVAQLLPRKALLETLAKYPRVQYYARRWTAWQLVRLYIQQYTKLYYLAALRGAQLNPPMYSQRGAMEQTGFDDIDMAVMEHMKKYGY